VKEKLAMIDEGLREVFPEIGDMEITLDTYLADIPDWDSMASVNFQAYLEQAFKVTVPAEELDQDITVGEVISLLEESTGIEVHV
jgi:acyl carrier protein